jgi:hypothetical protein
MGREEKWDWKRKWKSCYIWNFRLMRDILSFRIPRTVVPTYWDVQAHFPVSVGMETLVGDEMRRVESGLGEVSSNVLTKHSYLSIPQSVLRQSHSLFQSEFYTQCDLVLPVWNYSILYFHYGHSVAAYFIVFVFASLSNLLLWRVGKIVESYN